MSDASGHSMSVGIRRAVADDVDDCLRIVTGLTDHFTSDVPAEVRRDLGRHEGWVIADGASVLGFLVVDRRSESAAEILWAAVVAERRNVGLGSRLLHHVLAELGRDGVEYVEVKTLDESSPYPPYAATRAFWERRGFVQIDTIDPYPGWRPGNPAAVYVRALPEAPARSRPVDRVDT